MYQSKSQSVSFVKKTSEETKKEFKPSRSDRLVKVLEYYVNDGKMLVETMDTKFKYLVKVSNEAIMRCKPSEDKFKTVKFFGHLIDKRMEAIIPVGNKCVLENLEITGKKNELGIIPMQCSRVINITDQEDGKSIECLYTVAHYNNRISTTQVWDEKAYHAYDDEKVLLEKFKNNTKFGNYGCMFRTVEVDFEGLKAIDCSPPFDYVSAKKDEAGSVIEEGRILSDTDFKELLDGYIQYSKENYGDEVKIEVMIYKNYINSKMATGFDITTIKNFNIKPLLNTKMKLCKKDEDMIGQKCYAVKGVVVFTSDEIEKVGKQINVKERSIVSKLFYNGIKGYVVNWVRSSDDKKVSLDSELKVRYEIQ